MRLQLLVGTLLTFLTTLAAAVELDRTIDIFAWPLSDARPQTLATVTYNLTHAAAGPYKFPTIPSGDNVVRIGFHHSAGSDSFISTAASNLQADKQKTLQLLTTREGEVYHLGFKAVAAQSKPQDQLIVEVVRIGDGPKVHLNKPVVVSPDGKVDEKEEKNFFQK